MSNDLGAVVRSEPKAASEERTLAQEDVASIAPNKAAGKAPAQADEGGRRKKEAAELHKRNMAFFAKTLKHIHQTLSAVKPKSELLWIDNDDVNLREGNTQHFRQGAKADATGQVASYIRNPSRIVFSKPSTLFEEIEGAVPPVDGEFEFATQRYDDKNTDDHSDCFVRRMSKVITEHNVNVEGQIVRDKPYYFVIYGIGLGCQVMPLIERFEPEVVVILEPDIEWVYQSTFVFDWQAFHDHMDSRGKKIRLIFDPDPSTMLIKLNGVVQGECLLGLDGLMSYRQTASSTLNIVFNEFNSTKTANLASFIGYIVDEYNMMKNSFRNLKDGKARILRTGRKNLGEVPAIIVGSGPSLEDNIDLLKRMQDRAFIISSGSSINVLLKHGIRPDFHAVIERAKAVYDRHEEAAAEFGEMMSEIHLVTTTTIWPGIDRFFKDVVYFLRPALSPLAIFCNEQSEILNGEGPQVTNTSFAFARRLGFKEIYLLGVDLGSADPARPRAEKAWISPGVAQRKLSIPFRGNFGRTVFTDRSLIQQRVTIENQIRTNKGAPVYNLGNGVRIAGTHPKRPEDLDLPTLTVDKSEMSRRVMEDFPVYTRERFIGAWTAGEVRENVAELINDFVAALEKAEGWDHALIKRIEDINQYVNKPLRKQYAPRLLRGSLLRMSMYVNSVFLRLKEADRSAELFQGIRDSFIAQLREIELEAYALADELETQDEHFAVKYA